jgi:FixJ family two-component response regulator
VSQNGYSPSVLLVDDEEMVITSIKAFLQLETDFHVEGFTDPEEAARHAEKSRVLLTGHADKQSAIQAINRVALFQYLEKPWDNAQLLLVVESGAERARLFRDLREKVDELDSAHASLKNVQRRLLQAFL